MKKYILLLILFSPLSYAGKAVVPQLVIDQKSIAQLEMQLNQLRDTYDTLVETRKKIENIQDNLSGKYGYGKLIDNLASWQWTANTWQDELTTLSGGNNERYNQLAKEYEKAHPTMNTTEYTKGASPQKAALYEQNTNVNKTAYVEASKEFGDINQRINEIHDLSVQIDQTDSAKKSMDLNSRLITELAYLQTEQLRMQTLINQQFSQSQAASIAEDSLASKFNQLPEN